MQAQVNFPQRLASISFRCHNSAHTERYGKTNAPVESKRTSRYGLIPKGGVEVDGRRATSPMFLSGFHVPAQRRLKWSWNGPRFHREVTASSAAGAISTSDSGASISPVIFEPWGKGIVDDLKRRLPHYGSDIRDGLNIKAAAVSLYLFFACLAPAVAFGGLLHLATNGHMGAFEMIAATAICGVWYALCAGQPLNIIGSTGPELAFTAALYSASVSLSIPFLPAYAWVGVWTALITLILSLTSASNLVRFFTRFTDEIFAGLISVIFVVECVSKLAGLFVPGGSITVASLSLLYAALTYSLATSISEIKSTAYFPKKLRSLIADFAPSIAVLLGSLAAHLVSRRYNISVEMLGIPSHFGPTLARPWVVDLFAVPPWVRWGAILPGIMGAVLVFMDQNITSRLVNSSPGLVKGEGYHLDMLVIALQVLVCSLVGFPWLLAATVRAVSHVRALTETEKDPVSGRERVVSVMENRVTGVVIHALIGMTIVFYRPLLRSIPVSVLMGLFLFLGFSSMKGSSLFDRVKMMAMEPSDPNFPQHPAKGVAPHRMHVFTGIQLVCLAALMWIKESDIGIFFPVLVALLVPIRDHLCPRLFTKEELHMLDPLEHK